MHKSKRVIAKITKEADPIYASLYPELRRAAMRGCGVLMRTYLKMHDSIYIHHTPEAIKAGLLVYKDFLRIFAFIKSMQTIHNIFIYKGKRPFSREVAELAEILTWEAIEYAREEYKDFQDLTIAIVCHGQADDLEDYVDLGWKDYWKLHLASPHKRSLK